MVALLLSFSSFVIPTNDVSALQDCDRTYMVSALNAIGENPPRIASSINVTEPPEPKGDNSLALIAFIGIIVMLIVVLLVIVPIILRNFKRKR